MTKPVVVTVRRASGVGLRIESKKRPSSYELKGAFSQIELIRSRNRILSIVVLRFFIAHGTTLLY